MFRIRTIFWYFVNIEIKYFFARKKEADKTASQADKDKFQVRCQPVETTHTTLEIDVGSGYVPLPINLWSSETSVAEASSVTFTVKGMRLCVSPRTARAFAAISRGWLSIGSSR